MRIRDVKGSRIDGSCVLTVNVSAWPSSERIVQISFQATLMIAINHLWTSPFLPQIFHHALECGSRCKRSPHWSRELEEASLSSPTALLSSVRVKMLSFRVLLSHLKFLSPNAQKRWSDSRGIFVCWLRVETKRREEKDFACKLPNADNYKCKRINFFRWGMEKMKIFSAGPPNDVA